MKTRFLLFLALLCVAAHCSAQQSLSALTYQVANDILMDLHPYTNPLVTMDEKGNYHLPVPFPGSTHDTPLLLMDHPYSAVLGEEFVLADAGTPESLVLLKHFTPADVEYMQAQMPTAKRFSFEQDKIKQPGVRIIALDTLMALNKRLGWQAEYAAPDSLQRRYGSRRVYGIWGLLFAKDHRKVLVVIGYGEGWDTVVYAKTAGGWHRTARLQTTVY